MNNFNVIGGDFARRLGWFYPEWFVLHDRDGRPQRIPLASLAVAEPASPEAIMALGADESLVAQLEDLRPDERAGAFVALFSDGRILLGVADPHTREVICAGRGRQGGG